MSEVIKVLWGDGVKSDLINDDLLYDRVGFRVKTWKSKNLENIETDV